MVEIDVVSLIRDIGFPIAICLYLLITRDSVIKQNTEALQNLKTSVDILAAIHKDGQEMR